MDDKALQIVKEALRNGPVYMSEFDCIIGKCTCPSCPIAPDSKAAKMRKESGLLCSDVYSRLLPLMTAGLLYYDNELRMNLRESK